MNKKTYVTVFFLSLFAALLLSACDGALANALGWNATPVPAASQPVNPTPASTQAPVNPTPSPSPMPTAAATAAAPAQPAAPKVDCNNAEWKSNNGVSYYAYVTDGDFATEQVNDGIYILVCKAGVIHPQLLIAATPTLAPTSLPTATNVPTAAPTTTPTTTTAPTAVPTAAPTAVPTATVPVPVNPAPPVLPTQPPLLATPTAFVCPLKSGETSKDPTLLAYAINKMVGN